MFLLRLVTSELRLRRARTALTISAVMLSVSLIVALTSGYASLEGAALTFLNRYIGAADAYLIPSNATQGDVPENLVDQLRADPAVRQAVGRLETDRPMQRLASAIDSVTRPDRVAAGYLPPEKIDVHLIGIQRPGDTESDSPDLTSGQWFNTSDGNFAVVDQVAEQKIGAHVGDMLQIPGLHGNLELKVVGVVHKPAFFAEHAATIYVPIVTLQRFIQKDQPPVVSHISIYLRADSDFDAFKDRWKKHLADIDTNLSLHMRRDTSGELEHNTRGLQLGSYFAGTIAMLTATFIIFSALSMGITERQRTLAMLRAVGATRGQLFRMVVVEGILIALGGAALGIPLGIFWVYLLAKVYSDMFVGGAFVSGGGVLFAFAGTCITALLACILPGFTASRLSPLEALNSFTPRAHARRLPVVSAIFGILIASYDPLVIFGPVESVMKFFGAADPAKSAQQFRFISHIFPGTPMTMLGFFLMAPLAVWIVERLLAMPLGTIFAVPPKLVRQQLSGSIWRAAGTAAALMVGLGTLVIMQIQGQSMIGGWHLPDKFPDIFIYASDIIPFKDLQTVEDMPGIAKGSLMPIVVTTPQGDSRYQLAVAMVLSGQPTNLVFFAVNPDQAFDMIELEFRDNDGRPFPADQQATIRAKAQADLKKGRNIIITDEYRQTQNLKIGDTLQLQTSKAGKQIYTICGIVWSPGADVVTVLFDLGRLIDKQTVGSVFGSIDDAKRDFGVTGTRLFSANLEGGIPKEDLLKKLQSALGNRGLSAGDVRQIKYSIDATFAHLLSLASGIAFAAMAVASLGVTNTVMASVRSRRWQFGVLRSIGVSRGQLLRLVLIESSLLAIVGIVLGLLMGLLVAIDKARLTANILGYNPPMSIPWGIIAIGCTIVAAVAQLASLWPAISAARSDPLDLLQAGRAAM